VGTLASLNTRPLHDVWWRKRAVPLLPCRG
jgi:hypothetical protein